jgi:hypothetical protein
MESSYHKALGLISNTNIAIRNSGGCSELVKPAEKYLGVFFPKSYKEFIKDYGYVSFGGLEIYGIIDADFVNSSVPDVVWLNYSNRVDFGQPANIIVISDLGDGSYYALDLSQMNDKEECPVVIWPIGGYEATSKLEVVAPDFGTWFLEKVKEQIGNK